MRLDPASAWRIRSAEAAADRGGEAEELAEAHGFRGGQVVVEVLDQVGDGAQARALLPEEVGVERLDGGVDRLEDAVVVSVHGHHRLLPGRDLGADDVLLDHGDEGVGDALGLAHKRGDGGVAGLVQGRPAQLAEGGERRKPEIRP